MNAPANFTDAAPVFTVEQADAILAVCNRKLLSLSGGAWGQYADIRYLALGVQDFHAGAEGFSGIHSDMQDALDAIDCHDLWQATAAKVAA